MRALLAGLIELALPPLCGRCHGSVSQGNALCSACAATLPEVCPWEPPPAGLAACYAAVRYEGEVLAWIHRFKYPRSGLAGLDPAAASVVHWLAGAAAARALVCRTQLLVPVPLHPRRLRMRGFNPAAVLGRTVAEVLGVRSDPTALSRVRDTRSQTGLGRRARQRNVRRAFQARVGLRVPEVVCLVDDVVTTGSTLGDSARALREAGARTVLAVCLARTALAAADAATREPAASPAPRALSRRSPRGAAPGPPAS
jgi:ComF family protein